MRNIFQLILLLQVVFLSSAAFSRDILVTLNKDRSIIHLIASAHTSVGKLDTTFFEKSISALKKSKFALLEKTTINDSLVKEDISSFEKISSQRVPLVCLSSMRYLNAQSLYPPDHWTQLRLAYIALNASGNTLILDKNHRDLLAVVPDQIFLKELQKNSIPWQPIESADQIVAILREIKPEDASNLINRSCEIRQSTLLRQKVKLLYMEMESAYSRADLERLTSLNAHYYSQLLLANNYHEKLIIQKRNTIFLKSILTAVETHKEISVIVGAAHLSGAHGLIEKLVSSGFTFQR